MIKMKSIFTLVAVFFFHFQLESQTFQYEISLEPISIPGLGGLQSYAIGNDQGEWLIFGGRLDGLHQRQPFASFTSAGNNDQIMVVNPETGAIWSQSIGFLPSNIKEQLASTNMQYYQDEEMLIFTGGYAFSPSKNEHITFPYLTVLNVPEVISKVKNGNLEASDFQQIEDDFFAVTGGRLNKIEDTYYLVGGHRFIGRYNPMGPNHGPGFIQDYTDAVRKFELEFDPILKINSTSSIIDGNHLHRRDYNLIPSMINQNRVLMLYSGVFQKNQNTPWLYPVSIDQDTINAITSFQQKFNHYHCATLPIYHPESQEMHTLFFGGIAQFYEEDGILVQDNDVPFVNTIADVAILSDGSIIEHKNKTSLPGYLGAGSEFVFAPDSPMFDEGIVNGDSINTEQTIGYIYGGIRSTLPNIFFINTGNESEASETIYRVKLNKALTSSNIEIEDNAELKLQIYPNPAQRFIRVLLTLSEPKAIEINIFNVGGQKIHTQHFSSADLTEGQNYLILNKVNVGYGTYFYKFKIGTETITRKVIWSE
jgi:hypothetical protein